MHADYCWQLQHIIAALHGSVLAIMLTVRVHVALLQFALGASGTP